MKVELGQRVTFQRHYTPDRVCWRNDLDAPIVGVVVGEGTIEECFYDEDGLDGRRLVRFVLVREKLRGRAYRVKREDLRPVEDGETVGRKVKRGAGDAFPRRPSTAGQPGRRRGQMSERRSIRLPVPTEDGAEVALILPHALTVDERDRIKQIVDSWLVNPAGEEEGE